MLSAGALLGAPLIVPPSAFTSGTNSPNERIRMGVIGVGKQGSGHIFGGAWTYLPGGLLARKDVQILAVCDVWRDRREAAAQKINAHYASLNRRGSSGTCKAYRDFRELLARDDIDAVLIATPPHWHASMSCMAAAAGKDIYCEEPTAVTICESQAVRDAVRRYARVYQGGTQQRSEYSGKFRQASEFIRSGRTGKLKEVYAYRDGGSLAWPDHFPQAQAVPADLDWDLFLGPAPAFPYDGNTGAHRFDLGDLSWAQHHYDLVQWALGADDSGPTELFMEKNRSCCRYPNGVLVYGKPHPAQLVGTEGGACFVGTQGLLAVDRNRLVSDPGDLVREPLRPDEVHLYRSESHPGNFLHCVRTRGRTICDADVAHRSASAMLLGGIVKQVQGNLTWDPQIERFINSDAGNRLLSIARRSPWSV